MLKLFFTLLTPILLCASAKAGYINKEHKRTKKLVRLSLWYEGTDNFDKSMFRPGAAGELAKQAAQAAEKTAGQEQGKNHEMTEELLVALDNLNS